MDSKATETALPKAWLTQENPSGVIQVRQNGENLAWSSILVTPLSIYAS
jgi:hypothetical protein